MSDLLQELDRLSDGYVCTYSMAADEIRQLYAERDALLARQKQLFAGGRPLDELVADAERFRWLRQIDRCEAWENLLMMRPITRTEDIDAAIDAARKPSE